VSQNGFVIGVYHMLNVGSIRRGAGRGVLIALGRQWTLSEARGADENRESNDWGADETLHVLSPRNCPGNSALAMFWL
jgi:hypothetical protein